MGQNTTIFFCCWVVIVVCSVLVLKLKFGLTGKSRKFYLIGLFVLLVPMPLRIISEIVDSGFLKIITFLMAIPVVIGAHYLGKYLHEEKKEK